MFISFVRTIILYFMIILAVRVMGKRQINQLQTSELVVTLLISDLAAIPMQDSGQPLFSGLIPILVLIALEVLVSVFMLKKQPFSPFGVRQAGRHHQRWAYHSGKHAGAAHERRRPF